MTHARIYLPETQTPDPVKKDNSHQQMPLIHRKRRMQCSQKLSHDSMPLVKLRGSPYGRRSCCS
jgi:hypothetical protein